MQLVCMIIVIILEKNRGMEALLLLERILIPFDQRMVVSF